LRNSTKCQNEFNEGNLLGYKVIKNKVNHSEIVEIEVELAFMHMKDGFWVLFEVD